MRKTTILLLFFASIIKSNAQITLTRADFPDYGDVFYTFNSPDSIFSIGPSGANVIWDFSQMHINPPDVAFYWLQSINSTTTHKVNVGAGGLTSFYYYLDSSIFKYVGSNSWNVQLGGSYNCTTTYDQKLLTFPFTYNDFFIDSFAVSGSCTGNPPPWNYIQTDSIVSDAYGTLILPFGTYDALRIYREEKLSVGPVPSIRYSYTWYTNNNKCPLLQTSGQYANGNYRFGLQNPSPTIGIKENSDVKSISCIYSGNPGKYIVELNNNLKYSQVNIFLSDLQGRNIRLATNRISESKIEIDISNFSQGIYFLNIYGKGFNKTFKLVNSN